jgi:hypothetical protein
MKRIEELAVTCFGEMSGWKVVTQLPALWRVQAWDMWGSCIDPHELLVKHVLRYASPMLICT